MKKTIIAKTIALLMASQMSQAGSDIELLRQEMLQMKKEYEQRMQVLENRLQQAEGTAAQAKQSAINVQRQVKKNSNSANTFNPAISVILDGRYADFENAPENYELPGFALGGEAGLGERGFSVGHTEVTASANIDDKFYGQVTAAIHEHEGETEVELEEAFIQTLGLGNGLNLKAGRFLSGVGYLNQQHEHVWDFVDAPLIYRGLFGNQLRDDGVQLSFVAPTETFLELGAEMFKGGKFPGAGDHDGIGAWTVFANVGGDIGLEHSWQAGLSHWQSDVDGRTSGGHSHAHEGEEEAVEIPSFGGDSKINSVYLVYKWAPNGNAKNRNLKLQFEYFDRKENGTIQMLEDGMAIEESDYNGHQKGWYAQAIYQFMPSWRTGVRYDLLDSDNRGSDMDVISEAGLANEGIKPKRYSAMLEWLPSEFSRVRLQFNHDKSYEESDNQVFLQYSHSFGSHGAHNF